jgi:hypothetical protein
VPQTVSPQINAQIANYSLALGMLSGSSSSSSASSSSLF